MKSLLGRRVLKTGFVLTTSLLTCTALQADHNEHHGDKAQAFVHKALMGGQMEVQMGRLAEQKGQAQEVKSLGSTLVRDHTAANQRLEQLASSKNFSTDKSDTDHKTADYQAKAGEAEVNVHADKTDNKGKERSKHQAALSKLENQTGAEFDKSFVRMAIKDHKKDIAEFEKCRTDVSDPEIKAFIDETLPKLRNHLQMAQSAARVVGVDESTIAADREDNDNTATGAPAAGASGTLGSDKPSSPASQKNAADKERSSYDRLNGATDADASGTVIHNTPRASVDANVGDRSLSANTGIDRTDRSATTEVNTDNNGHKIFQKGDGKVLGLSTDKNDGKFLGIIPDPKKKHDNNGASVNADVDVNGHDASVGAAATTESSSDRSSK